MAPGFPLGATGKAEKLKCAIFEKPRLYIIVLTSHFRKLSLLIQVLQQAHELGFMSQSAVGQLQAKVSSMLQCGSTLLLYVNSQLPYPYVALVSLTVHVHLFLYATW